MALSSSSDTHTQIYHQWEMEETSTKAFVGVVKIVKLQFLFTILGVAPLIFFGYLRNPSGVCLVGEIWDEKSHFILIFYKMKLIN